jgi:hypothetical protein
MEMKLEKTFSPQRHRDTEENRRGVLTPCGMATSDAPAGALPFGFSPCLCASVVRDLK